MDAKDIPANTLPLLDDCVELVINEANRWNGKSGPRM
jgi:hypothetical protein